MAAKMEAMRASDIKKTLKHVLSTTFREWA